MVKNDFFKKSKKMLLPTPKEVLYSKNEVASSKTVTCRSRTDIHTYRHKYTQSKLDGALCDCYHYVDSRYVDFPTKSLRDLDKTFFSKTSIYDARGQNPRWPP